MRARRRGGGGRRPEPGERPRQEAHWVFGRHVVEELLVARKCRVLSFWVLTAQAKEDEDLVGKAKKLGAKVSTVPKKELDRITDGGAHQGLALKVVERSGQGLKEFLSGLSPQEKGGIVLVAMDQIQDPHNFGAIARGAVCLGAAALIYPERRSAPLTQAVLSSSAGAISKIKTFPVGNLAQTLERLKEEGFWVYGADGSGKAVWDISFNRPFVLVIGSEGKGMRPLVRRYCDEIVAIPQSAKGVASLNASCAATVLLYEAARQAAKS